MPKKKKQLVKQQRQKRKEVISKLSPSEREEKAQELLTKIKKSKEEMEEAQNKLNELIGNLVVANFSKTLPALSSTIDVLREKH
ncbi:hypothetical protein [Scytonema sp. PCC 10023]|uniref:hypothetical protein n=1 Tax=Scytonema sp. PCC 10023 TaxID=1680591 RepID=UPI0039C5C0F1